MTKHFNVPVFDKRTYLLAIILVPFIVMMPVLMHPHYGLFSDAQQLIVVPRTVLSGMPGWLTPLLPLSDGRWNPLFHGLSVLIYAIVPESPFPFYVAQLVMLWVTVLILSHTVYKLNHKYAYAILAIVLYCLSSSFFENYYTLDKVEPRIVVFSAMLFLFIYKKAEEIERSVHLERPRRAYFLIFFLTCCAIFSKETGVFLVGASGAVLVLTYVSGPLKIFRRFTLKTFLVQLIALILFSSLFKLLAESNNSNYTSYSLNAYMIARNVAFYMRSSPELIVSCIVSLAIARWIFKKQFPRISKANLYSLMCLVCAFLAYMAGISLWRWPLEYYLLPAQYFNIAILCCVLPLALTYAKQFHRISRYALVICLVTISTGYVAFRLAGGVAIFAFDEVKDTLAKELSKPEYRERRFIVPFDNPGSSEIAQRLEYFINAARKQEDATSLFNFWELPSDNRKNLNRFDGSIWWPLPTADQLASVSKIDEDVVIWSFRPYTQLLNSTVGTPAQEPHASWDFSTLRPGDLVLLPTGLKYYEFFKARGLSMHGRTLQGLIYETKLNLTKIDEVRSGIGLSMNWDIVEVN
ncbi:hypothetical protein IFT84_09015 [Rhizobium sp. CFBP 8762]|uniref:hypothetical protein n=1 Tax=Rhizobium sp. CFBP 8762 TaxID=2775279 RepID=UPI0017863751|nr:hypothetical protein [Rhizobium sp. CFBP 8762]MBD8554665.1 hypothetical protein [Rhizobium sp. CFBP 8762]